MNSRLEKSGQLGDYSPEHDEYLREALLKLFDFEPDNWIIDRLQPLFDGATSRNRQYYADRGKILLARAVTAELGTDRNSLLNDTITDATLGLQCDPDPDTSDAIFLSQRGFAQLLLSQGETEKEKLPSLLNSAVTDLREAAKIGLGGAALSQALLSLSYSTRRDGPAEAIELLSEAKEATALIADHALRERVREQIVQHHTGVAISRGSLRMRSTNSQNFAPKYSVLATK